jgi:excisionase family DNA binding protein
MQIKANIEQSGATTALTCSTREAAGLLGVSDHTIFRLIKRGKLRALPFIRHKRIPRSEIERFIGQAK